MIKRLNIAVLMGGRSPEHEISLISGREVVRNLPKKYTPLPLIISKDGARWQLTDKNTLLSLSDPLNLLGTSKDIVIPDSRNKLVTPQNIGRRIDVCFIAMHGQFGEDGTIQGLLELAGIRYTGSGVLASALGMDKIMFRKVIGEERIPFPRYMVAEKGRKIPDLKTLGKPPYFVKPFNQGSSVGASIVKKRSQLRLALRMAFKYSNLALIDEYISGTEVTCSVLGNESPFALPVIEINPLKGEFFDYKSKYTESGAEEIVPARISKILTRKIQEFAIKVHKLIGCRGFSRVDFILKDGRHPYVLEINTIPGLTQMSLLPKAAKAAGLSYSKLLDKVINYALK